MASNTVWVKVVIPVVFIILTIAVILLFLMMLGIMPGMSLKKATGLSGDISVASVNCVDLIASHAITSKGNMQALGGGITLAGDLDATGYKVSCDTVNCVDLVATHAITSKGNMQALGGGITLAGDLDATGYKVTADNIVAKVGVDVAPNTANYLTLYNGNLSMSGGVTSGAV
jgi:hypothetical protein